MAMTLDAYGTGIGGPGMWDPMPLPPPVTPPEPRQEEKLIWSRPETITPEPVQRPTPRKRRTTKRKARAKKRPVKKRAAGVKKRARKKATKRSRKKKR